MLYEVRQFKNETGAKIWLIHRILQFNSYPLQCRPYSSSLSRHRCIHVLHYSKQCYSSSTLRPFSGCAVFALTSSTDGKWVPFSTLFTLVYRKKSQVPNPRIWRMFKYSNPFIGKKLLEQKGLVSWGIVLMQHPDFVLPEIQQFLP